MYRYIHVYIYIYIYTHYTYYGSPSPGSPALPPLGNNNNGCLVSDDLKCGCQVQGISITISTPTTQEPSLQTAD